MSLRLLLGRAGTGKTARCLTEIQQLLCGSQRGNALVFLVPDQATFQMEQALTGKAGLDGIMRAHVLSFPRLAWKVMNEAGGISGQQLGDTGKNMVIRYLLQKNQDQLRVFDRAVGLIHFPATAAALLSELKIYCLDAADLREQADNLPASNQLLIDKLHDVALLSGDFDDFIRGRYFDPEDYLSLLAERIDMAGFVHGAEFWVDGFNGFTPQELKVLERLMMVGGRVTVSLCLDTDELKRPLEEQNLFYQQRRTMNDLIRIASEAGMPIERVLLPEDPWEGRFAGCAALRHLEEAFEQYPRRVCSEHSADVKLTAAHNRRAEVEGAAREIIRLARDRRFRWKEMAVSVRDLDAYGDLIEMVFTDYGIPAFVDRKRPVLNHPVVELLRSALETVISNWSDSAVFHYLKTDFAPLTRDEADELENYVLAHGIRGRRWTDERPWDFRKVRSIGEDRAASAAETEMLARIQALRTQAVSDLITFEASLKQDRTVRGISTALYELTARLGVKEKLEMWAGEAEAGRQLDRAGEHAQIYNQVLLLLDEVVEVFGDTELALDEYLRVLEAGLSGIRLGLIPPGLDQVFIGSLDRSRIPAVRAHFLLGVNDGVLPARIATTGLLTDDERSILGSRGLRLSDTDKQKLFDEQFLVYTGLTRASQYLWISYALADQEGGALNPSPVIRDIQALLPWLEPAVCPLEPTGGSEDQEYAASPRRSLSHLATQLREAMTGADLNTPWPEAYNWYLNHQSERLGMLMSGLFADNQETHLPLSVSRALYGQRLRAGITEIERFNGCPFAHFVQYGLRVREREVAEMRAPDLGQFFHAAMKRLVERITDEFTDLEEITDRQLRIMVGEIAEELVPQLQNEIALSSERSVYLIRKLKTILWRSASVLLQGQKLGAFQPVGLEVGFGYASEMPALELSLADQGALQLIGRIDRIDAAQGDEQTFLRVIDYKSGQTEITLPDIYYGLRLQLLTYLYVALENAGRLVDREAEPGAMLYYRIHNPLISSAGPMPPAEAEAERTKKYRMNGMILQDDQLVDLLESNLLGSSTVTRIFRKKDGTLKAAENLLDRSQFSHLFHHLIRTLQSAGEGILGGEVDIQPVRLKKKSACTFCGLKAVCQFDPQVGNQHRVLKLTGAGQIWQMLQREGE